MVRVGAVFRMNELRAFGAHFVSPFFCGDPGTIGSGVGRWLISNSTASWGRRDPGEDKWLNGGEKEPGFS